MKKSVASVFYYDEFAEDSVLKDYVKSISKFKELSEEDEKYYIKLAHQGDSLAKRIVVQSNLKLVFNIAKKTIMTSKLPMIDLLQEGNLGLIASIEKFNPDLGFRFSTYASWWIKQAMFKAISEQSYLMKIPVYVQETLSKYRKVKSDLEKKYSCEIQKSVAAKKINVDENKIDAYLNAFSQGISLETSSHEDKDGKSMAFSEIIEDVRENVERTVENIELKRDIETVLDFLKGKEQEVIKLRFGLNDREPMTLQEIGNIYGVTKECIRQMEKRAIKKIFDREETKELLSCYVY